MNMLLSRVGLFAVASASLVFACAPTSGGEAPRAPSAGRDAPSSQDARAPSAAAALPSWRDGAAKSAILRFVDETTTEGSPRFVPALDRVAVFDNDGTLWTEQPAYTETLFTFDRVKALAPHHPQWASTEPFRAILAGDLKAVAASGQAGALAALTATHGDVSVDAFREVATKWLATSIHPKYQRAYRELTYVPMLEVLQLLRSRGFRTFMVTGGDVDFARGVADVYGMGPEAVIGSTMKTRVDGSDESPSVYRLPQVDVLNDGPAKVASIVRVVGRRPILAFGNSDGDVPMLRYTVAGSGPRLALLVHHTDSEREAAYDRDSPVGRLAIGLDEAPKRGFVLVDMKSDWARVFAFDTFRP